jgi:hypothetical protein
VVTDDGAQKGSINTVIGVVIPVEKIVETINHPELVFERQKIVRNRRASGATPDLAAADETPTNDLNPAHREDFTSLLNAAAKKKPQDDQI